MLNEPSRADRPAPAPLQVPAVLHSLTLSHSMVRDPARARHRHPKLPDTPEFRTDNCTLPESSAASVPNDPLLCGFPRTRAEHTGE